MESLGDRFRGDAARVHLVGGSCLVYEGLKPATVHVDLDIRETPEGDHGRLLQAIRQLKEELDLNVEEASPADFIPLPSGARERARLLARHGHVDFFHYDPYSTALSKIDRGQERDFEDVLDMLEGGWIEWAALASYHAEVLPKLETKSLKSDPARFTRHLEVLEERWSRQRPEKSG